MYRLMNKMSIKVFYHLVLEHSEKIRGKFPDEYANWMSALIINTLQTLGCMFVCL